MAVNINTVYQRVLAILNKEQRGFVSPVEFNLFANQAQMDIFEQYFYDLNQFLRIPGNETRHADPVDILEEKIDIFEKFRQDVTMSSGGVGTLPSNVYRLGNLSFNTGTDYVEIEHINQNHLNPIISSPLTSPTTERPIYIKTSETAIQVYPTSITSGVTCNYIAAPTKAEFGFTTVLNAPQYNASLSTDFELHHSEETKLVVKILALAGLEIKDVPLFQVASAEDNKNVQQEKQ